MLLNKTNIDTIRTKLLRDEITLEAMIEESLTLMQENEQVINAFLPESNRKARLYAEAEALKAKFPAEKPPLYGILIGVKDLYNVDGYPTQAGSKIPAIAFAGKEASLVSRLKELGALILGKTVSTEFAYFQPGATRNPQNPEHTPGGSSSGSAAAVASGYCPVALGTQTIASVIRPASFCGIFGFKPSHDRIKMDGIFPFSQSADTVGFLTQTLEDQIYLSKLLFTDWSDYTVKQDVIRIGVATGTYLEQADLECRTLFQKFVEELQEKGVEVKNLDPFGDISIINKTHRVMIAYEFAQNHHELYQQYQDSYSPHSRELYLEGAAILEAEYHKAEAEHFRYRVLLTEMMHTEGIDLWLTPSTLGTAPHGIGATGSPLMSLPWSFVGLPSLSIPYTKAENKLPQGLQFMAGFNEDERLLGIVQNLIAQKIIPLVDSIMLSIQ